MAVVVDVVVADRAKTKKSLEVKLWLGLLGSPAASTAAREAFSSLMQTTLLDAIILAEWSNILGLEEGKVAHQSSKFILIHHGTGFSREVFI